MRRLNIPWFSQLADHSIAIIQSRMAGQDNDINRLLRMATAVGFGQPVSEKTRALEELFYPSCRKCIAEAYDDSIMPDSPHLPLWGYLGLVGAALDCTIEDDGNYSNAALIFACGQLWGEIESKFQWQAPVEKWNKAALGGEANRLASDEDRREFVRAIAHERGKGFRDAFRIAAQRRPHWGKASTFKRAHYEGKGVQ